MAIPLKDSYLFSFIERPAEFGFVVICLRLKILQQFVDNVVLLRLWRVLGQVRSDGVHVLVKYVHNGSSTS
ncbi:MAG: hypothetical protein OJF49_001119 [Ktedonobacterales bacterium]|nr:MAG: hypothetical protein OJF49_001119 [Ktedonobacterales bacterium]